MTNPNLKKIRFDLRNATNRDELPDEIVGETMWAEPLGQDLYRLQNSPGYVLGYAVGDTVRCLRNVATGWDEVVALVADSGNGNIRIYFEDVDSAEAQSVIAPLKSRFACTYEQGSSQWIAVDVPPMNEERFSEICDYLNTAHGKIVGWEVGKPPSSRSGKPH